MALPRGCSRTMKVNVLRLMLMSSIIVIACDAEDDNQESEFKPQSSLPFSFLDKLPFLKEFSSYEPIPHDERDLKEMIFVDNTFCPKLEFEEIIFNKKCFNIHSSLRPKATIMASSAFKRLRCNPIARNITDVPSVKLLNSSELLELLGKNGSNSNHCTVILFYALWCAFSVRMAPAYNAIARAFPALDVVAIDAYNFGQLNSRFGSLSVPTMMIFHNGKALSKYNKSERTLETMREYISNITGIKPNESVVIENWDYEGPLPSRLSQDIDYALWLSWAFIIICIVGFAVRSEKGISFYLALKDLVTHQAGVPHHID